MKRIIPTILICFLFTEVFPQNTQEKNKSESIEISNAILKTMKIKAIEDAKEYEKNGKKELALNKYKKAQEVDPNDIELNQKINSLSISLGKNNIPSTPATTNTTSDWQQISKTLDNHFLDNEQKEVLIEINFVERSVSNKVTDYTNMVNDYKKLSSNKSLVTNAQTPKIALENFRSEIARIKNEQEAALYRAAKRIEEAVYALERARKKSSSATVLEKIAIAVEIGDLIIKQTVAIAEKKQLENYFKNKMVEFRDGIIYDNNNQKRIALSHAVNEPNKKQEAFYLDFYNYLNCYTDQVLTHFSYSNVSWVEPSNCNSPKDPKINSNIENLNSNECLEIAKHKLLTHGKNSHLVEFQNSKTQNFKYAAQYYLDQAIKKDPRNAESYQLRATLQDQNIDKFIDLNFANFLDPNNQEIQRNLSLIRERYTKELFNAIEGNDQKYIKKSIEFELYHNLTDKNGYTPILSSIAHDNPQIFELFLKNEVQELYEKNKYKYLFFGASKNAIHFTEHLHRKGLDVVYINTENNKSALYYASIFNAEEVIDYLISVDVDYISTLNLLQHQNNLDGIKHLTTRLFLQKINSNYISNKENNKVFENILHYNPNVYNEIHAPGESILQYIIKKDFQELLSICHQYNANLNYDYIDKRSLISLSIIHHSNKCFDFLITNKVNLLNYPIKEGSLLHTSIKANNSHAFETLTSQKISSEEFDKNGNSVVSLLVQKKKELEYIKYISYNTPKNINTENKEHLTPLHYSVITNQPKITESLLSLGTNVDQVNNIGQTALHLAAIYGLLETTEILVTKNASLIIQDFSNKSPYSIAKENNNLDVANYLKERKKNERKFDLDIEVDHVTCKNFNNGKIKIIVEGGFAPFRYNWEKLPNNSTEIAENLIAGLYTIEVIDTRNNIIKKIITIKEPDSLTVSLEKNEFSSPLQDDGKITTKVKGGKWPYHFNWNTGETDRNLKGIKPSFKYRVTVMDRNNCQISDSVEFVPYDTLNQKNIFINVSSDTSKNTVIPFVTWTEESTQKHWENANTEYSDKNYTKAIESLNLIEDMPNSAYYFLLAQNYDSLSNARNAERYYKKAIDQDENNLAPIIGLAKLYENKNNLKRSIKYYKRAIELNPENLDLHLSLSKNYKAQKMDLLCEQEYSFILTKNAEKYYSVYLLRAEIYRENNDYMSAITDYSDYLSYDSLNSETYFLRGLCYVNIDNSKLASLDFNFAKDLGINDIQKTTILNLANNYYNKGLQAIQIRKEKNAQEAFSHCINLDPIHSKAYFQRGKINLKSENYEIALIDLNKSIILNNGFDSAFFYRANLYIKQNNVYDAINNLTACTSLNNKFYEAFHENALLHAKLLKFELSKKLYLNALEIKPKLDVLYTELAFVYFELKEYEKTIETATKGIHYNRTNSKTHFISGKANHELKKFRNAIKDYEKALEFQPDYSEAFFEKGNSLLASKKYSQAEDSYRKAIRINPKYPQAYLMRARTLHLLRNYPEAKSNYTEALEQNKELENDSVRVELAILFLDYKKDSESAKLAQKYIDEALINTKSPINYFYLSCALSRNNNQQKAIEMLEETIKRDNNLLHTIKNTKYLDKLRKDKLYKKEFKNLLAQYKN